MFGLAQPRDDGALWIKAGAELSGVLRPDEEEILGIMPNVDEEPALGDVGDEVVAKIADGDMGEHEERMLEWVLFGMA